MSNKGFLKILSVTATCSSIGLFFCGLQICARIRRRGTTDGTSVAPFWLTSVSCIFWFGYGVKRNDDAIIFVNGIGLIFQLLYFVYYYIYTRSKQLLNKLIAIEILVCFFTYYLVNDDLGLENDFSSSIKENSIGIICMLLNIATIGSPLLDIVCFFSVMYILLYSMFLGSSNTNTE